MRGGEGGAGRSPTPEGSPEGGVDAMCRKDAVAWEIIVLPR